MEKSFGLLFFLRKPKGHIKGEVPLYLKLTVNGVPVEISTKRRCDPDKWNTSAGRMSGKTDSTKEFNDYLDTLQQKVFEAKRKLLEIDKEVTAENIKDLMLGKEIKKEKRMLMEIFQQHNDQMKALVGHEFSAGSANLIASFMSKRFINRNWLRKKKN